jgi:hypothetical protein
MVDVKVRAVRVMMDQAGLLKLGMSAAQPQVESQQGMLFRRTVEMPPGTDLESLLAKWNPGVPSETVHELMTAVCRWNQLKDSDAVRPGQKLLIPSVLPHGKEPRKPLARSHEPLPATLARQPPRSPSLAVQTQIAESRMRSKAPAGGVWISPNQEQARPAGAQPKQQLQAGIWQHRRA